ncbi:MAG: hypothetical protein JO112_02615 [Planctomycetes bacterium]|nr:hypothetical protein [Planctomycetota bacterium]
MWRIESPLIQELVQELVAEAEAKGRCQARREDILDLLEIRFGTVPPEISNWLSDISDEPGLRDLYREAALCPDLQAFLNKLSS